MAKKEEHVKTAAQRRDSRNASEGMLVIGRNVRRRDSTAFSELTRSNNVKKDAVLGVDRRKSSGPGIACARVPDGKRIA